MIQSHSSIPLFQKKLLCISLGLFCIIAAIALAILVNQFYPSHRVELPGIPGSTNRIFVKAVESIDTSLSVYASDWPHTFSRPFMLGEADRSDSYSFFEYYWSVDGSVIVNRTKEKNSPIVLNTAAYDFKNHRVLDPSTFGWNRTECDRLIFELVETRGGRSLHVVEIPDIKSGHF